MRSILQATPQDPGTSAGAPWRSSRTLPHCPGRRRRIAGGRSLDSRLAAADCSSLRGGGLLLCERARRARRLRPQASRGCLCPAVGLSSFWRYRPVAHPRPVLQRGWGRGARAGASEAGRLRDGFGRRRVTCKQPCACHATIVIDARMAFRAAPRGRPAARGGCGLTSCHPLASVDRMAISS